MILVIITLYATFRQIAARRMTVLCSKLVHNKRTSSRMAQSACCILGVLGGHGGTVELIEFGQLNMCRGCRGTFWRGDVVGNHFRRPTLMIRDQAPFILL